MSEVLIPEENQVEPFGAVFDSISTPNGEQYTVRHICLDDSSFESMNTNVQALLPFFIDGASPISPNQFWHYFLVYNESSGHLACIYTVFHAH